MATRRKACCAVHFEKLYFFVPRLLHTRGRYQTENGISAPTREVLRTHGTPERHQFCTPKSKSAFEELVVQSIRAGRAMLGGQQTTTPAHARVHRQHEHIGSPARILASTVEGLRHSTTKSTLACRQVRAGAGMSRLVSTCANDAD